MKVLILSLLAFVAIPAYAEDWTTTDGTVYQDVKVIRVEDDAITILFKDGGALVPLAKLPPDLQQRFSYDPVKAKAKAAARAKDDAANAKELQAEMDQAQKLKLQQQVKDATQKDQANKAPGAL